MRFALWVRSVRVGFRTAFGHPGRRSRNTKADYRRPLVEVLETRTVLSPYVVTTTADSGSGSLRDAVDQVNADTAGTFVGPSGIDEIDFHIQGTDPGLNHYYYKDNHGPGVSRTDAQGASLIGTTTFDDSDPSLTVAQIEAGIPDIDPDYPHTWWSIQVHSGPDGAGLQITRPVVINSYSQPGSRPNDDPSASKDNAVLRIEIDGSLLAPHLWAVPGS